MGSNAKRKIDVLQKEVDENVSAAKDLIHFLESETFAIIHEVLDDIFQETIELNLDKIEPRNQSVVDKISHIYHDLESSLQEDINQSIYDYPSWGLGKSDSLEEKLSLFNQLENFKETDTLTIHHKIILHGVDIIYSYLEQLDLILPFRKEFNITDDCANLLISLSGTLAKIRILSYQLNENYGLSKDKESKQIAEEIFHIIQK
ncbi:hypothetical protein F9817_20915 [Vibrio sp. CAIM 722]|uniref:Uncharacterized protein n=1 Tax=Vibrio eleionomae TaxID=2653505 RepID=A0A7X4RWS2_9VIBR|nr:hypothetical protein [Vibrio eleionomae]MZI95647.1 hypothetical protein [Vibrio eleionomae]